MYYEEFLESLTECEQIINEEDIKMKSIHPYEIISDPENALHEASISKETVSNAITLLIKKFELLLKKAKEIALKLMQKNKAWFESVNSYMNSGKELKIESHEMYNYEEGIRRIESTHVPKFDSIDIGHFENNGEIFKEKAFGDIFTKEVFKDENGKEIDSIDMRAKTYFRGSPEKKKYSKSELKGLISFAYNWTKNYNEYLQKIIQESEKLNADFTKIIGDHVRGRVVTESVLLHESAFKDDYFDILLEDALDPTDVVNSKSSTFDNGNQQRETPIDTNKEENQASDDHRVIEKAARIWYKTCTSIETAKIDVCEEAYKAFVDFIDKCMDNSSKSDTAI